MEKISEWGNRFKNWVRLHSEFTFAAIVLALCVIFIWLSGPNDAQSQVLKLAAISTLFAAASSLGSLLQAREAQRQREMFERPYIVIAFEQNKKNGPIDLLIENIGNRPAIDVILEFESPLPTKKQPEALTLATSQFPLRFLPPGRILSQSLGYLQQSPEEAQEVKFSLKYSGNRQKFPTENITYSINHFSKLVPREIKIV